LSGLLAAISVWASNTAGMPVSQLIDLLVRAVTPTDKR